jgi:hypothetical protein
MQYMKLSDSARAELMFDLAQMPRRLRDTLGSLSRELSIAPGPNGMFSPVEQVWHLADLEVEGFGVRIERLLNESKPELPDFDGTAIARERRYSSLSIARGLDVFEAARRANIERLRTVPESAWGRSGVQVGVGDVSLCDMPVFLRQHDLAHLEEIKQWRQSLEGRVV